jgi:hypothetical protein
MSRELALRIAFNRVAEMYTARNKGTVTTHPAITPRRVYQTERTYIGTPARPAGARP